MQPTRTILSAALFVVLASSVAFGWGNATHTYFAKQLGVRFGPTNLEEMYGAVLPDLFNYDLTEKGQTLAYLAHNYPEAVWGNVSSRATRGIAYGFMSHNNAWGADYVAHVMALPFKGDTGYFVAQGVVLAAQLIPQLTQIISDAGVPSPFDAGLAMYLAPEFGHDLCETAVDVLLRRNQDPEVGLQIIMAAKLRPRQTADLLVAAYGAQLEAFGMTHKEAAAYISDAERSYRDQMIQYGEVMLLPEKKEIAGFAAMSAAAAELFITVAAAQQGITGIQPHVDPAIVVGFIDLAIKQVKNTYAKEVALTLAYVRTAMKQHGIGDGCQRLWKEGDEVASATVPTQFSLDQNYPNPFNPSTTISYAVPNDVHVTVKVYNMLGEEVATLVDEVKPAGMYQAVWDAGKLASGAYICRLTAGSFAEIRRMMLVK